MSVTVTAQCCVDSGLHAFIKQMDHSCLQVDHDMGITISKVDDSLNVAGDSTNAARQGSFKSNIRPNFNTRFMSKSDDAFKLKSVKEAMEVVNLLLSERLSRDSLYFVFDESVSKENKENNEVRSNSESDTVDLTSSIADVSIMRKERILMDSQSSNESQSRSIFGSPLKLQAIADLSAVNGHLTSTPSASKRFEHECFKLQGLSIQQARNVLRKFCQSGSKVERESLLKTIVILCDGCDTKNTILLGAHREETGGNAILRTFCSTLKSNQRVKLSSLEPFNPVKVTEYHMSGDYEMLDKRESLGFMLLQAKWIDHHGTFRISNLHSAKFSLKLAAKSGCPDSPVYQYFKQLEEIRLLFKALMNEDVPCINKKHDHDAVQNLQHLFTRIKKGEESGLMSMNCDNGKKINLSPQRDSDFTDKIWTILQQCTSYDDMLKCLSITLGTLKKKEMSVYVHKDNQTILAQLARQSSLGFASFPPLIGGLPLKIIVEIGLEKIKRDYCTILTESGLCSNQDLEKFVKDCQTDEQGDVSSYNVEKVKESQMEMIQKLHHCLELVCMMDSYSEHLNMSSLVQLVLNQYRTHQLDENQIFTVPVVAKEAILQIKTISACMIRRECELECNRYVDCYLSELPDSLAFPVCVPFNSCDVSSSVLGESKEFYAFQTKESVKVLGHLC